MLYLTFGLFSQQGHCFPSMAMVELENGKSKPMSKLQVGDKVKTGTSKQMKKHEK